jgi:hypothetical protein
MADQRGRVLDEFLVDNDDLSALNARLSRLNLFRVLRIERAEIRHSNVLGWLLDPNGLHGLGDVFLRRFLSRLLLNHEGVDVPFSAAQVELMDLDQVTVRREWRNIDVLVVSESPPWCLVIENKIGAGESSGQLARYREAVSSEFPRVPIVPVFLTLEGADPSEEGRLASYVALSYSEVLDFAERLIQQRRSQIPDDARVLLDHWCELMRRLTMSDKELVDLCRRIYRRHRQAIDLIVEYGVASGVLDACAEAVHGKGDLAFDPVVKSGYLWFMPKEMAAAQRPVDPGWSALPVPYPFSWWFMHDKPDHKLRLVLELSTISDGAFRRSFLEACKSAGFKFRKGGFGPDARYTRIWSGSEVLGADDERDDDPELVAEAARKLWSEAAEETPRLLRALSGVTWPEVSDRSSV